MRDYPRVNLDLKKITIPELQKELSALPTAALQPLLSTGSYARANALYMEHAAQIKQLGPVPATTEERKLWESRLADVEAKSSWLAWADAPKDDQIDNFWNTDFDIVPDHWGVFVGPKMVNVVTDRYNLIQHSEAFAPIIPVLEKLGVKNVCAKIDFTTEKAYAYVSLPENFSFIAPDGAAINLGFVGVNAYDSTHSVEWSGYGYRQTCKNGMIAKRLLGGIRAVHTASAEAKLYEWVNNFSQDIQEFNSQIELAMSVGVTRQEAETYARAVSKDSKRFVELFMRLWDDAYSKTLKSSMWALYNAATDIYSHKSTSLQTAYAGLASAEVLLTNPEEIREQISSGGKLSLMFKSRDEDNAAYAAAKAQRKAEREAQLQAEKAQRKAEKAAKKAPKAEKEPEPEVLDLSLASQAVEAGIDPSKLTEKEINIKDLTDEMVESMPDQTGKAEKQKRNKSNLNKEKKGKHGGGR